MFRNHLKIAFRNLWRQKGAASINIGGLALGLLVSLFIFLWVGHEMSYDRFHEDGGRIYQVFNNLSPSEGRIVTWSNSPEPYGEVLAANLPEVESKTYLLPTSLVMNVDENSFTEAGYFAGHDFFDVFSFPMIEGDPKTVLKQPGSILITEVLAGKYFGADWQKNGVIGKSVRLDNSLEFQIAGILKTVPANSSLQFDFLIPMEEIFKLFPGAKGNWGNFTYPTYLKLKPNTDPEAVNSKMAGIIKDRTQAGAPLAMFLHPLEKLYLHSNFENGKVVGGRIDYVRIFFAAAAFVLLIACINYMNLATAYSSKRSKEVGVRKVVGAVRSQLVGQFLVESMLTVILAAILALIAGQVLLPQFNFITGKELSIDMSSPVLWVSLVAGLALTGLLAGSYPALMLSSFRIINVLKGKLSNQFSGVALRKGMVGVQFILSVLLIVGALAVREQILYIKNKNIGLDKDNVIMLGLSDELQNKTSVLKEELLQLADVEKLTFADGNPLSIGSATGDPDWEGKQAGQGAMFNVISTDHEFLRAMNIKLAAGRDFEEGMPTDTANFNYLVNEKAVEAMGLEDPVGKRLQFWGFSGRIIGVVRDFHFSSLHRPIEPLIIRYDPAQGDRLLLKPNPGKTEAVLSSLESIAKKLDPATPFEYEFLDKKYEAMYRSEMTTGRLAGLFALIALIISCLGLLGLAAFTAEQRTKEIGIRKVLGASAVQLVRLISADYMRIVGVAILLATPLAWWAVQNWLSNFAYRIPVHWWMFAASGGAAVLVAMLTVATQAVKAALGNPVEALRNE
jgi:putative ABC transport system permease protein